MTDAPEATGHEKHWLVRPSTIRKLIYLSIIGLSIVALLDFAIKSYSNFGIDGTPFFYSWYGFVTCVGMVVAAKLLGIFLKRKDSYYDD